jgi:hypothetical protein
MVVQSVKYNKELMLKKKIRRNKVKDPSEDRSLT